jgi:hypothetical protein
VDGPQSARPLYHEQMKVYDYRENEPTEASITPAAPSFEAFVFSDHGVFFGIKPWSSGISGRGKAPAP